MESRINGNDTRRPSPIRNLISRKKPPYPVSDYLAEYLGAYDRLHASGVRYEDLLRFDNAVALHD